VPILNKGIQISSSSSIQFQSNGVPTQHSVGQLQKQREVATVEASKTKHMELSAAEYYKEQIAKKHNARYKRLKI
jgi:hypothetical protein